MTKSVTSSVDDVFSTKSKEEKEKEKAAADADKAAAEKRRAQLEAKQVG